MKNYFLIPENTASGSLKMQDSTIVSERRINCYLYSLVSGNENVVNQEESLNYLKNLGFNVPTTFKKCKNIFEVKEYVDYWENKRGDLDVETDGIVIKVNNLEYQKILGIPQKVQDGQ